MVRIRFPPEASQQRTVPAVGFDGGESCTEFADPLTWERCLNQLRNCAVALR